MAGPGACKDESCVSGLYSCCQFWCGFTWLKQTGQPEQLQWSPVESQSFRQRLLSTEATGTSKHLEACDAVSSALLGSPLACPSFVHSGAHQRGTFYDHHLGVGVSSVPFLASAVLCVWGAPSCAFPSLHSHPWMTGGTDFTVLTHWDRLHCHSLAGNRGLREAVGAGLTPACGLAPPLPAHGLLHRSPFLHKGFLLQQRSTWLERIKNVFIQINVLSYLDFCFLKWPLIAYSKTAGYILHNCYLSQAWWHTPLTHQWRAEAGRSESKSSHS